MSWLRRWSLALGAAALYALVLAALAVSSDNRTAAAPLPAVGAAAVAGAVEVGSGPGPQLAWRRVGSRVRVVARPERRRRDLLAVRLVVRAGGDGAVLRPVGGGQAIVVPGGASVVEVGPLRALPELTAIDIDVRRRAGTTLSVAGVATRYLQPGEAVLASAVPYDGGDALRLPLRAHTRASFRFAPPSPGPVAIAVDAVTESAGGAVLTVRAGGGLHRRVRLGAGPNSRVVALPARVPIAMELEATEDITLGSFGLALLWR